MRPPDAAVNRQPCAGRPTRERQAQTRRTRTARRRAAGPLRGPGGAAGPGRAADPRPGRLRQAHPVQAGEPQAPARHPEGAQAHHGRAGQAGGAHDRHPHGAREPAGGARPPARERPRARAEHPVRGPAAQASGRNPARAPPGRRAHADRGALAADGLPLRGPRLRRDRPQALQPRAAQVVRKPQLRADPDGERGARWSPSPTPWTRTSWPRRGRSSAPASSWRSPGAARSSAGSSACSAPASGSASPPPTRARSFRWSTA